jgi:hypothetical protein
MANPPLQPSNGSDCDTPDEAAAPVAPEHGAGTFTGPDTDVQTGGAVGPAVVAALAELLRRVERDTGSPTVDTFDAAMALAEADDVLASHRGFISSRAFEDLRSALDHVDAALEAVEAERVTLPLLLLDLEWYAGELQGALEGAGVRLVPFADGARGRDNGHSLGRITRGLAPDGAEAATGSPPALPDRGRLAAYAALLGPLDAEPGQVAPDTSSSRDESRGKR